MNMNFSNKSLWFTGFAGAVLVLALLGFWITSNSTKEVVEEPVETPPSSLDWEGTYEFYEDASQPGGAPMFTAYDMSISKAGDRYAISLTINGHMQAEEIMATGVENGGKLTVMFDSYGEYKQPDRFSIGDVIFELERSGTEKLKVEWKEMQPNFSNTDKQNSFFEKRKEPTSGTSQSYPTYRVIEQRKLPTTANLSVTVDTVVSVSPLPTISGTASGLSTSLLGMNLYKKDPSYYGYYSGNVMFSNGRWSATLGSQLTPGNYTIDMVVLDGTNNIVTTAALVVE
jgi:hypothetical protein